MNQPTDPHTKKLKVDKGSIEIFDEEYKKGDYDDFRLDVKKGRATVKVRPEGAGRPKYYSVAIPDHTTLKHFQVHAREDEEGGNTQVVAIAFYHEASARTQGQTTCIRCGNTIVCGVNPQCGDSPPDKPHF